MSGPIDALVCGSAEHRFARESDLCAPNRRFGPPVGSRGIIVAVGRVERGSRHWIDRLRPIRRWSNRFEALQVRWLGTNGIAVLLRVSVLAIETLGWKSGRRRRTAVAYLTEDGCFLIGGGAAGQARLPDWVANLRANPSAVVWVRRRQIDVVAEELRGEARDQAYERNLVRYPRIAKYEQMSGREIPYFRLVPLMAS